jgi:hypothetical protein
MPILTDKDLADLQAVSNASQDYTCTVLRGASLGTDSDGQPLPATFTPNLANQPCLVVQDYTLTTQNIGEQASTNEAYELDRYLITFPVGTDVLTGDMVTDITDRNGNELDPTVPFWDIKDRVPRYSYLAFVLQAIR